MRYTAFNLFVIITTPVIVVVVFKCALVFSEINVEELYEAETDPGVGISSPHVNQIPRVGAKSPWQSITKPIRRHEEDYYQINQLPDLNYRLING